jgi:L-ascorbate metabolism protein UlaG (beta-lactamase superfamily)/rhodanese-related sulfurtransferase
MKNLFMCILSLLSLFGCKGYEDLTVDEFEKMLAEDSNVQLVDVRTAEEYAASHLPGAINIDWRGNDFLDKVNAFLSKDRPTMVYCRSGRRSAEAAALLDGIGIKTYNMLGGYLAWTEAGKPTSTFVTERFMTPENEPVDITYIKHATLAIKYKGMYFHIDPVSGYGTPVDYAADFPKADFILITHEHGDHFDKEAIAALRKDDTQLIANAVCAEALGWGTAMANGDDIQLSDDISVKAIPAYNITEGHLQFHPQDRDNGYILTLGGLKIYIAGDTEVTAEMSGIKNIDIAFLPVNQPYTMTVDQCIEAAKTISPKILIPYHFGQTDITPLPHSLPGIEVRLRDLQ